MFTIDQIHAAFGKVASGADFPQFVRDLQAIGVTHYDNHVADGRTTYLISFGWPGPQVRSRVLRPALGSKIMLLGWSDLLPWEQLGAVCVIETPREMADEENHPCKQAFVFKVESPR